MAALLLALAASALAVARAVQLPSVHSGSTLSERVRNEAKWSVHLGDRVYYTPPVSMLELSQESSSYYYTMGSEEALTSEMKAHRVGGEGRMHILHLPKGPSMLQIPRSGDRRAAFSSLVQLQHGAVHTSSAFPAYVHSQSTQDASDEVRALEAEGAKSITSEVFRDFLSRFVAIGANGMTTRSYSNAEASKVAEDFLLSEFTKMGLTACLHEFTRPGHKLANIVGYLPGAGTGSLTVGAHYDSRPFDAKAPGAEDNGSGVAAMLSVAHAFTSAKVKPQKTVYFVAFAAEEPGCIGSAAFVSALEGSGWAIPTKCQPSASFLKGRRMLPTRVDENTAIILDEVGWVTPKFKNQTINFEATDLPGTISMMDHMLSVNTLLNAKPLEVVHNNAPFGSDHMSFLNRGMPAVLVVNGDDEAYPNYHKSTDTIENVNMDYATKVTKIVFGGAIRTAGIQA